MKKLWNFVTKFVGNIVTIFGLSIMFYYLLDYCIKVVDKLKDKNLYKYVKNTRDFSHGMN